MEINYTNQFGEIALGRFQFPERLKSALTWPWLPYSSAGGGGAGDAVQVISSDSISLAFSHTCTCTSASPMWTLLPAVHFVKHLMYGFGVWISFHLHLPLEKLFFCFSFRKCVELTLPMQTAFSLCMKCELTIVCQASPLSSCEIYLTFLSGGKEWSN